MKRLLSIFLLCATSWATTTISGHMATLGTTNVSGGAFMRFYLRGCAGNQPRVSGVGLIGPTLGGVFFFDFPANSIGNVSGTLYSNRDSTGNNGGEIECGGSLTATWYGMVAFVGGKAGPEIPVLAKSTGTLDISNVTPITTNPTLVAPTGDSTYLRLDAGNSPVTGPVTLAAGGTFNGNFAGNPSFTGGVPYINGVRTVDGVKYANIAAAVADLPSTGAFVIALPTGYRETFTSHVDLGNGTTQATFLFMASDVKITCNVTDASYCFQVHDGGGIIGIRNQALTATRGDGSVISLAATANLTNVIQTGENPQAAITLQGFEIDDILGGAVSNAFYNIVNLNNAHTIRDISGFYFPNIGLHISATTGGIKSIGPLNVDNAYFDGTGLAGARPLVIESDGVGAINGVMVRGGFYLNPGTNHACIEINGNGSTTGVARDIIISGVYMQQSSGTTGITGVKIIDAAGVVVQGGEFQLTDASTGQTGILIDQGGAGRTHSILVENFRLGAGGSNRGILNNITSETILTSTGNIPLYVYQGSVGTQLPSPAIFGGDTKVTLNGGITADGAGYKHKRFASPLGGTCPTGTSIGNACTSANLNWTTAFPDNNYSVSCTLTGVTNQPHIVGYTKQAAGAGITITIATDLASAANAGADCIATHD